MSDRNHLQTLADEFNAKAKAEGRYLEHDFWEIPSLPGSILDVPQTPDAMERVARLRAQIASLQVDAVEKNAGGVLLASGTNQERGPHERSGKLEERTKNQHCLRVVFCYRRSKIGKWEMRATRTGEPFMASPGILDEIERDSDEASITIAIPCDHQGVVERDAEWEWQAKADDAFRTTHPGAVLA